MVPLEVNNYRLHCTLVSYVISPNVMRLGARARWFGTYGRSPRYIVGDRVTKELGWDGGTPGTECPRVTLIRPKVRIACRLQDFTCAVKATDLVIAEIRAIISGMSHIAYSDCTHSVH